MKKLLLMLFGSILFQFAGAQFFDATLELAEGAVVDGGVQPKWHKIVFKEDGGKARTYLPDEIKQLT